MQQRDSVWLNFEMWTFYRLVLLALAAVLPVAADVTYTFQTTINEPTVNQYGDQNPNAYSGPGSFSVTLPAFVTTQMFLTPGNCVPQGCGVTLEPANNTVLPGATTYDFVLFFRGPTLAPITPSYSAAFPRGALSQPGTYKDVAGIATLTVASTSGTSSSALRFLPLTPCRVLDTRPAPISAGTVLNVTMAGKCAIPAGAAAYSLNVTVVPQGSLGYLTIWPKGQTQPLISTLNSLDGRIKANAAIVPAGTNGDLSVFVTNTSDVVLDVNGVFVNSTDTNTSVFYPVTPCRVADTRNAAGPFGGPAMTAGQARTFAIQGSACNIPTGAQAYSLNFTVVPSGPLGYLTAWPAGATQPLVSTLNALTGAITANAAIVPAGTNGSVSVFTTNPTDLVIDINGYFSAPGRAGALSFFTVPPCRVADTRLAAGTFGAPALASGQMRSYPIPTGGCSVPATAKAYSLNATVVPNRALGYLTLWSADQAQPYVSTLNALDGSITSNAALVPAALNGAVAAYASDSTDLILDINGYFAP